MGRDQNKLECLPLTDYYSLISHLQQKPVPSVEQFRMVLHFKGSLLALLANITLG